MRRTLICVPANGLFRLMQSDIERVLFDGPAIHKRLDEIAAQITVDYSDRELTVIAILTGSLMFMSDLLRRIPLPLKLDCLSVASYHGKGQPSDEVIFKQLAVPDVAGRDVLILDDILDTGHTLEFQSRGCGYQDNFLRGRHRFRRIRLGCGFQTA